MARHSAGESEPAGDQLPRDMRCATDTNGKLEKRKDNKGNTEVDNYHVYCAPVDANGKASRCAVKDGAGPVEYRTPAEEYKHWAGNDTPGDGHASRSGRGDPKASPPAMIYTEVLSLRCFCCN